MEFALVMATLGAFSPKVASACAAPAAADEHAIRLSLNRQSQPKALWWIRYWVFASVDLNLGANIGSKMNPAAKVKCALFGSTSANKSNPTGSQGIDTM